MRVLSKQLAWITAALVVIAVATIGGFWLFPNYTADKMCGNQIIDTYELPKANVHVVVFQRDCGATTGFSTQISLLEIGQDLANKSGNIFSADTDHGKAPSVEGGGPEVRVEVVSGSHIKIFHHPKARVFNNQKQWKKVFIEYGLLNSS
ncbi:MAG: hypothetical protein ABW098_17880 [Candidatus Thiodiazotropha sp.]